MRLKWKERSRNDGATNDSRSTCGDLNARSKNRQSVKFKSNQIYQILREREEGRGIGREREREGERESVFRRDICFAITFT